MRMDVAIYYENKWKKRIVDYSRKGMRNKPFTCCSPFGDEIRIMYFSRSSFSPPKFRITIKYKNKTTHMHDLHACELEALITDNKTYKYLNGMDSSCNNCIIGYFQRCKNYYVNHHTKQVLVAFLLEYHANPTNYKNGNRISNVECILSNEYLVKLISQK
jgi:hypothetical protein